MKESIDYQKLAQDIKIWGSELGFQQVGISDTELSHAEEKLKSWLGKGYHGELSYMTKHGSKRTRPPELLENTLRIISVRMDYLPANSQMAATLAQPLKAYISRYALGRDYHKLIRKRLQQLANRINEQVHDFSYRAFVDSAPVMEKPIAEKAGLGWIGKHTNLINKKAGSWFFLGELYTNLPLPVDETAKGHCGSCTACLTICPTQAIVAPFQLDARRCISYLTIELKGAIPEALRKPIGNRIFGCDDCQLICPWNKFARPTGEKDFHPRHNLDSTNLITLFNWTETEFMHNTVGSPISRLGYERWLRNIAVALGNAPSSPEIIKALQDRLDYPSNLVREHITWALQQLQAKSQL